MKRLYNRDILNTIHRLNMDKDNVLSVLVLFYNDLKPTFIPEALENKIYKNFFELDNFGKLKLKYPLYEDEKEDFYKQIMDKFKEYNKERRGDRKSLIARVNRVKQEIPVDNSEILEIISLYLQNTNPQYIKKSHKFFYDRDGSLFMDWYEIWKENNTQLEDDAI